MLKRPHCRTDEKLVVEACGILPQFLARGRPYCTLVAGSHPSKDLLSGNFARNLASVLKRDSTNNCKQCGAEDQVNARFGEVVRLQSIESVSTATVKGSGRERRGSPFSASNA